MKKLNEASKLTGLELLTVSSVWNFHGSDHLCNVAMKDGSNLNNSIRAIYKSGYRGGLTLIVGGIGRSQHSKTEVGIFKGITNIDEYQHYYTKGCDEVFIKEGMFS